jgi:hypothetical protein
VTQQRTAKGRVYETKNAAGLQVGFGRIGQVHEKTNIPSQADSGDMEAQQRQQEDDELRRLQLKLARRAVADQPDEKPPGTIGRPEGPVPVPAATFWEILRLIVFDDASARCIDKTTNQRPELAFVNRNKAGDLIKWVEANPSKARNALTRHEIPRHFRATDGGVIWPKS